MGSRAARRHWGQRLATAGCAILVALASVEVGLRLFWVKHLLLGAGIEHPHFHHRLKPSATYDFKSSEFDVVLHTNRYGLRGPDPVIPKPPGTRRVLMLGDSFTFGFPVKDDDTFVWRLQQALRVRGAPVEVINGGVSGTSPTLHYIALRDQFLQFEPDLVLLWYDVGDLMEDHAFQKNLLYDAEGRIVRADPRYVNGRFDAWGAVQRHSALARWINTKLLRTFQKIRLLGAREYLHAKLRGERSKVAIARLKHRQRAPDLAASDKFLLVRENTSLELARPYWELSARYLRMIRDLLQERHIRFAVGIYPYGMLAGPEQWAQGRVDWGFEPGRTYAADTYLALLEQWAAADGVPLINTFDSFRAAAPQAELFYRWDGHFTPEGHRVLSDHLLRDPAFLDLLASLTASPPHLAREPQRARESASP
jgi:lysophospholipase L1-like esterase